MRTSRSVTTFLSRAHAAYMYHGIFMLHLGYIHDFHISIDGGTYHVLILGVYRSGVRSLRLTKSSLHQGQCAFFSLLYVYRLSPFGVRKHGKYEVDTLLDGVMAEQSHNQPNVQTVCSVQHGYIDCVYCGLTKSHPAGQISRGMRPT